jgi:hypothetical protein
MLCFLLYDLQSASKPVNIKDPIMDRTINDIYFLIKKQDKRVSNISNKPAPSASEIIVDPYDSTYDTNLQNILNNIINNIYDLQKSTGSGNTGNNSYWEIDPVYGGLMTRDTALVTISDDYWELGTDGGLYTK